VVTPAPARPEPLPLPPSGKHIGATPVDAGVEFRVWAPNARSVFVIGEAAGSSGRHELTKEDGGFFASRIEGARAGQKYRFEIATADPSAPPLLRLDPRGRAIDGNESVIVDPRTYGWKTKAFTAPARERAVIYEMHIGSFHAPAGGTGTFATATQKLDALADLGIDAIELMPINQHGTKHGWGYNPQAYFAPHTHYGTPDELRALVDAAHERGIAVLLDVVYNHYDGWKEAPLWCFDGHCPSSGGGIYFFEGEPYKKTPWGPRPDFSKKEVSDFFADDVFAWMKEYRIDGLRHDSVSNVRAIDGKGTVPGGTELLRRLNQVAEQTSPASLIVAEDLKGHAPITEARDKGGLGFHTQWDGGFHWAVTGAVTAANDDARDLGAVQSALVHDYNGDPFDRLLYVESHDTAGNDGARLPVRIDAADPTSLAARRRTMLAAGVLLTAPGVPMLFMGQEMLEATKFMPAPAPLDWTKADTYSGVRAFHRDLIRLRTNADGVSAALLGKNIAVTHLNDTAGNKVIVYRRWSSPGDDMMVIANFGAKKYTRYDVGLPSGGTWVARIDGDHVRYSSDLGAAQPTAVSVAAQPRDNLPYMGSVVLGPYSIVVLGR
jgi:1,4-alpha-glucan branching enzyme